MAHVKNEGSHDANDTCIIEKLDGSQYITKDAYLETGYLHIPDANWSFRPKTGRKIPVVSYNVHGQPPTQVGLVYYADEEPTDPLQDPYFMNGVLPNVYNKAFTGTTRQDIKDRAQKRNVNMVFGLIGGVLMLGTILTNSQACGPDIHIIERPAAQSVQQSETVQPVTTPANTTP